MDLQWLPLAFYTRFKFLSTNHYNLSTLSYALHYFQSYFTWLSNTTVLWGLQFSYRLLQCHSTFTLFILNLSVPNLTFSCQSLSILIPKIHCHKIDILSALLLHRYIVTVFKYSCSLCYIFLLLCARSLIIWSVWNKTTKTKLYVIVYPPLLPLNLSVVQRDFLWWRKYFVSSLFCVATTCHMRLLSSWNVATVTTKWNLILFNYIYF